VSVELLNCDCMEYMKEQPDNSFDLAIVDPIYGVKEDSFRENKAIKSATRKVKYHNSIWNQDKTDNSYFVELLRVSKNQIIWGGNYFSSNLLDSRCWIVWDKVSKEARQVADCELAYTSFDQSSKIFEFQWNGMLQGDMKNKERRIHPTQKPVKLYDWLLSNYAKPDQRVLDTHLGSGSSAIAAHYFGCDFVGMEIDKDYYEAACKRFDRETAQASLFDNEPVDSERCDKTLEMFEG